MERYIEFITNHWMLFIALLVISYLLIQELLDNVFKRYQSITPIQAVSQLNAAETIILDVSELKEYREGHIDQAISIPSSKLEKSMNTLEKYKEMPILVNCQTGARSAPACKQLYKQGYRQVINLIGGLQAWEDQKLPVNRSERK